MWTITITTVHFFPTCKTNNQQQTTNSSYSRAAKAARPAKATTATTATTATATTASKATTATTATTASKATATFGPTYDRPEHVSTYLSLGWISFGGQLVLDKKVRINILTMTKYHVHNQNHLTKESKHLKTNKTFTNARLKHHPATRYKITTAPQKQEASATAKHTSTETCERSLKRRLLLPRKNHGKEKKTLWQARPLSAVCTTQSSLALGAFLCLGPNSNETVVLSTVIHCCFYHLLCAIAI